MSRSVNGSDSGSFAAKKSRAAFSSVYPLLHMTAAVSGENPASTITRTSAGR